MLQHLIYQSLLTGFGTLVFSKNLNPIKYLERPTFSHLLSHFSVIVFLWLQMMQRFCHSFQLMLEFLKVLFLVLLFSYQLYIFSLMMVSLTQIVSFMMLSLTLLFMVIMLLPILNVIMILQETFSYGRKRFIHFNI